MQRKDGRPRAVANDSGGVDEPEKSVAIGEKRGRKNFLKRIREGPGDSKGRIFRQSSRD